MVKPTIRIMNRNAIEVTFMDNDGDGLIVTMNRDGTCSAVAYDTGEPTSFANIIDLQLSRVETPLTN